MRILSILCAYLVLGCGLATADTFLIRSTDGGRTWTDIDPGPPYRYLAWFTVDPRTSGLYVLTQREGTAHPSTEEHLLVSEDGGQTWQTRQNLTSAWFPLAAIPASPDSLYFSFEES